MSATSLINIGTYLQLYNFKTIQLILDQNYRITERKNIADVKSFLMKIIYAMTHLN